jgi:hypothetical protein
MTASAFKNSWVGFSRRPDDFAALSFSDQETGSVLSGVLLETGLINHDIRVESWIGGQRFPFPEGLEETVIDRPFAIRAYPFDTEDEFAYDVKRG